MPDDKRFKALVDALSTKENQEEIQKCMEDAREKINAVVFAQLKSSGENFDVSDIVDAISKCVSQSVSNPRLIEMFKQNLQEGIRRILEKRA